MAAAKETLEENEKEVVEQFQSIDWDGVDQWDAIKDNSPSQRTEFLYNIDPLFDKVENEPIGHGAIR